MSGREFGVNVNIQIPFESETGDLVAIINFSLNWWWWFRKAEKYAVKNTIKLLRSFFSLNSWNLMLVPFNGLVDF